MKALLVFAAAAVLRADKAEAKRAIGNAQRGFTTAPMAYLKLQIVTLNHVRYDAGAERTRRRLDLQIEKLFADTRANALVTKAAAETTASVRSLARKAWLRKRFPGHLPRALVVVPPPCSCAARRDALPGETAYVSLNRDLF